MCGCSRDTSEVNGFPSIETIVKPEPLQYGFEIVKNFAHKDSFNVLAISRDQEGLKKLEIESNEINKSFSLHTLALDLTDSDSILKIVQYINSKFKENPKGVIILLTLPILVLGKHM